MAFSVPIPHLARTQAEPLLATVGNTPLLRLEKIPRQFPGVEIIRQTGGRLTHFVAGMGTSGTFTGITRRLKRDLPEVRCYSAQPSSGFHGLEGLKHMPTAIVPGIYDERLADGNLWIETEDAYRMVRRLAREEGLLVGISSGCNVHAATLLARELAARDESATIATVLCDSAEKYLSEHFWDE